METLITVSVFILTLDKFQKKKALKISLTHNVKLERVDADITSVIWVQTNEVILNLQDFWIGGSHKTSRGGISPRYQKRTQIKPIIY